MAGYISDVVEHVSVDGKGRAPLFWWGTTPPDGDASPWASAPIGSIYTHKENETVRAVIYFKADNAGSDDDWGSLSFGRNYAGQPMGLLLALTHN